MRSERNNSLILQKNKIMEEEKEIQNLKKEDIELLLDSFEDIYSTIQPRYRTPIPEPSNVVMFVENNIEYAGIVKTNYRSNDGYCSDIKVWNRDDKTGTIVGSEKKLSSDSSMLISRNYVYEHLFVVFEDIDYFKVHIKHSRKRGWISEGNLNIMYNTICDMQEEILDLHKKLDDILRKETNIEWMIRNRS